MRTLNLGVLAHVDAGKTSLTERLLHAAGVIDEIGSVDDGSTQTDTLALERRRGITIKSAVVSFTIDDVVVNLIDTPGHPDFIAEVERVLGVLDGAVLVISAVEGVQAQTRVLMRALRRLRVPTLVFVNKIDRWGARGAELLDEIAGRLGVPVLSMGTPAQLGSRAATFTPYAADDPAFAAQAIDVMGDLDEALLADFVADEARLDAERLTSAVSRQTRAVAVHPVYFGSAVTGAGVTALQHGITRLLVPEAAEARAVEEAEDPVGTVFKVERGPAGERVAYLQLSAGRLQVRDRLTIRGTRRTVTAIQVFDAGGSVPRPEVTAGRIARIWGLHDVQIGDRLGQPAGVAGVQHHFAPPTLESVVRPVRPSEQGALHAALTQLAEQDPLIDLRRDELDQETAVTLYGEVQKEVLQATLAEEYGIEVTFTDSRTICVERLVGVGAAVELIGTESNPWLATVGLRLEPAPAGTGVAFGLEVERGSMPPAFFRAVEESARIALQHANFGWEVLDCRVTMTHSGYWARQSHSHGTFDASMSSTAGDFRALTRLIVARALAQAGTEVLEPVHRFHLEAPPDTLAPVLTTLAKLRAVPGQQGVAGSSTFVEGDIPAAQVHVLQQALPGLTRGEGFVESSFDHYGPVVGRAAPRRGAVGSRVSAP